MIIWVCALWNILGWLKGQQQWNLAIPKMEGKEFLLIYVTEECFRTTTKLGTMFSFDASVTSLQAKETAVFTNLRSSWIGS